MGDIPLGRIFSGVLFGALIVADILKPILVYDSKRSI